MYKRQDQAGVVEQQPDSIEGIVAENSFAPYVPAVIATGAVSYTHLTLPTSDLV